MATALIVIDCQKAFASHLTTALPCILSLISRFQELKLPIFFTQHGHTEAQLAGHEENQLVKHWGCNGSIQAGSADWELVDEVQQEANKKPAVVVPKDSYDAFIRTELQERLRQMGVRRVVITGVLTNMCCDTTARSAFNRGFDTVFVNDATEACTNEEHCTAIRAYERICGKTWTTKDVMRELEGAMAMCI